MYYVYRSSSIAFNMLFYTATILDKKVNVTATKNGIVFGSHKQLKTLLRDHMVKLKIISLYLYI